MVLKRNRKRGNVLFLADRRNWAFDFVARSITSRLSPNWNCKVAYSEEQPYLDPKKIDLVYSFFWGERSYEYYGFSTRQVIKEVASYRWMNEKRFGPLSPAEFVARHLDEGTIVTTPSAEICKLLSPLRPHVYHCPNGVESRLFDAVGRNRSKFTLCWAGNPKDPTKGLHDVILPVVDGRYNFLMTDGQQSRLQMRNLYRKSDVIVVASFMESQPLPLIEGMACGCFPITTNVGIVPEIVSHQLNGYVLPNRSPEALRNALDWCVGNLEYIRKMGDWNARYVKQYRTWESLVWRFDEILSFALARWRDMPEDRISAPAEMSRHRPPSNKLLELSRNTQYDIAKTNPITPVLLLFRDWLNRSKLIRFISRATGIIKRKIRIFRCRFS
jgi:hypothetical protein